MNNTPDRGHAHIDDVTSSWQRERPDLDLSNFLLAIYVVRLGRIVDNASDRMWRKHFGISGADMRVLFALRRAGKPYARRPTDLFRALLVTSGAITKQVDRLNRLGLVERRADPNYSGGILIQLTPKGLKVANAATEMLVKNSPIAPGLVSMTQAERNAGRAFIERVLRELERAATLAARPKSRLGRGRGRKRAQV